jgi:hypothetical protein
MTEYQTRFLATSMRMLNQWGQQKSPIAGIQVPGVLVARDQNGTVIVPAPVDYVSWTPRIAGFVTTPALLALQNPVLWIPAKMTPLARQQLGLMAGRSTKAHNLRKIRGSNNEKNKAAVTGKRISNVVCTTCWSRRVGQRSVRLRGHQPGTGCDATGNA